MRRAAPLLVLLVTALTGVARAADLLAEASAAQAAVEERIRLVLAHGLGGEAAAVDADLADLERLDRERRQADLPRTGLSDDLRYLAAGLAFTRDARRARLEALLDGDPDPVVRRLAEHRLEADDAAAAEQLLADDRHNRRAALLNDAVRPFGTFSGALLAAAVNPILLAGSAVDSVVTTAVNLWNWNRLSTPEREALARYATALAREPRTQDAPEIARAVRRLGVRRAEALCRESLDRVEKALDTGDLDHALYYARSAIRIEGCEERGAEPLAEATAARRRHLAAEDAARWPADDPPRPENDAEARDYEALLVATALADPGAMIEAASRFRARHPESAYAASAAYSLAVARDLAGHRAEAQAALREAAADDDTSAGRRAAAVLASADFDRLGALTDAERRHTRDTARFVLLGSGVNGRTALYTATQLGAEGVQGAGTLGIVNVIGVLTRAWQAWRKDPISNQAIIDRGEELLEREPGSPDAPEVHERLAGAYERAGAWGRALMHLKAVPERDEKRIAKVEEKLAERLLEDAERSGNNPVLLETVAQRFSTTEAADTARARLAERRPGSGELALDRELLLARPALLGASALDLDPRLLDGDEGNGELADAGLALVPPSELRLQLVSRDDEPRVETRTLGAQEFARARAAAQEALYDQVLMAERRDPDTGRFERYIPFFIQGTIGDSVAVYPGVKYRRYRSEDRALYE